MELRCNSRGNPPITSYAWFKNSGRGDSKVSSAQTFSFNATERAAFICEATNRLGSHKSKSICVDIKDAPKDTSASISPSDEESDDGWVELSCSSRAKPPPSFTWFKKGPQISTQVATGIFHKVQFTQGGQYFCVAANTLGSQKSSPVSVRTKGLPGLWMYIVIAILGIGLLRSTHFMIKKWIQASSSSQAH
ncbi:B-cell receptor CD22-like [Poecilia reticulata]|uniref:B-cell receptor CD22-like n=1 Tax=Poecilia reticulata TaxID=8081 RepID=UPI0004A34203|nr:PREDICTED: B-cell receptor CD22-like [Poecilia reticulata]